MAAVALVFSPTDLIPILGINAAGFIDMQTRISTLKEGKNTDIVLLGGNPLHGYWYFLTAEGAIKDRMGMVDERGHPDAGKPITRGP